METEQQLHTHKSTDTETILALVFRLGEKVQPQSSAGLRAEQSTADENRETATGAGGGGEAPLPPPEVDGIVESPGSPARKGKGRGEEDGGRRQSSDRGGKGREAKATGRAGQAGRRVNQWRASASGCAWLALTLTLPLPLGSR